MSELPLLRWQFDLIWALAEYHLQRWTEDDPRWVPAPLHWTVHRAPDGRWRPDWADTEPDPVPAPTAAWVSWQLLWWWGTASDELAGRPRRTRTDVDWPGSAAATATALRALATGWRTALADTDPSALDRPVGFPWPSGHTVGHLLAWANVELTKNVAEIGQLRIVRTAHG